MQERPSEDDFLKPTQALVRYLKIALVSIAIAGLAACEAERLPSADRHVSPQDLKRHVDILASDDMDGRAPGTAGFDAAAVYVAEQFQDAGLEPAGASASYFQPIVFKHVTVQAQTAQLILRGEGEPLLLQFLASYIFHPNPAVPVLDITAPLIFAGYGLTAPSQGIDSYAGIDVAGKIVVVLSGVPPGQAHDIQAVLSTTQRKATDAAKAGAAGLIVVPSISDTPASETFALFAEEARGGRPYWLSPSGDPHSPFGPLAVVARLAPGKAGLVFEGAPFGYDDVLALVEANKPIPSFDLKISATARYALDESVEVSSNVMAKLPARSASREEGAVGPAQREALLLISHLDHLGRGEMVEGDDLYNGAVDNALGVAMLMETAKALGALDGARGRDIYFAALTAEETGLQGSQYLARHLPMPNDALTAVLNIDMPVALYPFTTIQPSGEDHSNLGAFAAKAAAKYGLAREEDPMPEEAIFVRSDHYSFVERGIPALYLNIGVETPAEAGIDGRAMLKEFLTTHYHQPSDDLDLPIDWDAAALFADVHIELLRDLANTSQAIKWSPGSFFNQPRSQP